MADAQKPAVAPVVAVVAAVVAPVDEMANVRSLLKIDPGTSAKRKRLDAFASLLGRVWGRIHDEAISDFINAGLKFVQQDQSQDVTAGTYTERRGFSTVKHGVRVFTPLVRFRLVDDKTAAFEWLDGATWALVGKDTDDKGVARDLPSDIRSFYLRGLSSVLKVKSVADHNAERDAEIAAKKTADDAALAVDNLAALKAEKIAAAKKAADEAAAKVVADATAKAIANTKKAAADAAAKATADAAAKKAADDAAAAAKAGGAK